MATDGESTWVSLIDIGIGAVSFVVGSATTILTRGFSRAQAEGQATGETKIWKEFVDDRIRDISLQINQVEARMNLRMSNIEMRKDRIDDRLEKIPDRDEMQAGFGRLERQIELLSQFVHERNGVKNLG